MPVPESARGAVRESSFWKEEGEVAQRMWRDGWWDAYNARAAGSKHESYARGRADYLAHFASRERRVVPMKQPEPLTVCGVPVPHVSGFVFEGDVRGFGVRFWANAEGDSIAHAFRGKHHTSFIGGTHEHAAQRLTKWINEKTGADAGAAPQGAGKEPPKMRNIVDLALAELIEHPQKDHERTDASVAEIAESIRVNGLLQVLLVQASTKKIIAGHRRKWGVESLGWTTVPCELLDVDDDVALTLLLISNNHVERPDPMRESASVAALLALPGWNVPRAAQALRIKPRRVALLAKLCNLSPVLQGLAKRPDHFLSEWPAEWLEQVAILPHATQETMIKENSIGPWVRDEKQLREILSARLHVLGRAPWKLDDARLVAKAGACTPCPKTTVSQPFLFGEAENPGIETARCLDGECWMKKAAAHVKASLAAAREEQGGFLVIVDDTGTKAPFRKVLESANTFSPHDVREVKVGDVAAQAAAIVDADGSVKLTYVATGAAARVAKVPKAKKAAAPKQDLEASRQEIAARREKFVVEQVCEALADTKTAALSVANMRVLLLLSGAYGFDGKEAWTRKLLKKLEAIAADDGKWARALWPKMRALIHDDVTGNGGRHATDAVVEWVAPMLGLDMKELRAKALEEIPDPTWWPDSSGISKDDEKRLKATKPPAAKKKSKKPAKPKAPKPRKTSSGNWANLTPEQRLARVNAIRTGRGLAPKASL